MQWLFVVGVGLEIAGALLVAVSLLLPIVLRQWARIAARGYLFPGGGPVIEDMLEPARVAVGAALLVSGFAVQLAAYVVGFHHDALIGWCGLCGRGVLRGPRRRLLPCPLAA